jgi:L-lysine exporter family protein LysE/ArgO
VSAFRDGFLLSLSLCLDLGIVNVAILRVATQRGGTPAFLVGLGSGVGDLVYALLSVAGVAVLLRLPGVRWVLWLGGTAVLLFLAVKMVREVLRPHELHVEEALPEGSFQSPRRDLVWGLALALASPSAILWFAAVGGSVIATYGGSRAVLLPFLAGFWLAGALWSAGVAYGAGALRRLLGHRLVQWLSLASAALFVFFAIKVFLDGLRDLG